MNLKIKNAINHFNDNKNDDEKKMNQTSLGVSLLPEMNPKTAGWYVGMWCQGKELGKLTPDIILKISQLTGYSLDKLFGIN